MISHLKTNLFTKRGDGPSELVCRRSWMLRGSAALPAFLLLLALLPRTALAQSDTIVEQAVYQNQLYNGAPTNAPGTSLAQAASVALFSGEVGDISHSPAPTDGQLYLTQAAIGQPIGGVPLAFFLPGVALLGPTNGTIFTAPANIPLDAQAWQLAYGASVQRVDFYATGAAVGTNVLVASVTNSLPGTNNLQTNWISDFPGPCSLSAVATDDLGGSATSAPVNLTVVPAILVNGLFTNTHRFTFLATNAPTITMTNPFGGFIRYTTDGSDPLAPNSTGRIYTGPFQVSSSVVIRGATTDLAQNPLAAVDSVKITIIPLYPLDVSTAGGGTITVSPPNGPYVSDTVVTLTATTSNDWSFLGWTGDAVTNASTFTLTMNGPKSVQAVFGTSLTVVQVANGFVQLSPANQSLYPYGSTVLLTAIPSNNFYFLTWLLGAGLGGSNSPFAYVVTNVAPTIEAEFSHIPGANQFSLTVEIGSGNGMASPAPYATLYPKGASVEVTATPSSGQIFLGWGGAVNNSVNPLPLVINSNTTLIANFTTNSPPAITITNPTNGASFAWPATIPIAVTTTSVDGAVTNVSFFSDSTNLIGVAASPPFSLLWSNAPVGTHTLTAVATANNGLSATSAPETLTVNEPASVFAFASAAYSVHENGSAVTLTVVNYAGLTGYVNYATADGTAHGGNGIGGDYTMSAGNLPFTNGQSSLSISIPIVDNFINGPSLQFQVQLLNPSVGSVGSPGTATVTIIRDDPGAPTNALLTQVSPANRPLMNGQLTVWLPPDAAGGQWRFPWEYAWRDSGDTATNLVAGDYPVEFREVPNWLAIPLTNSLVVSSGETTVVTNPYYATPLAGSGALGTLTVNTTVNNTQSSLPGTGWQFFGETAWRAGGSSAPNLLPDTYLVAFEPVSGYATPASLAVLVSNGMSVVVSGNYTTAPAIPTGVDLPALLATDKILDYASGPYGFSGQLQTDVGLGSGAAVTANVVLTAAHLMFNDNTLTYVTNAWWSFQEQAGVFQPEPLAPRGWYVLSGYAAQRTNDLTVGGFQPDQSSPQSQDLDVAALYFLTYSARTGFGGFVSSDAVPNPFLTGSALKTVVGYPVDGSMFGQVLSPGGMYATPLDSQAFVRTNDQVYAAPWLFSYPGNSGGPLCVQNASNKLFYPAAVYLGTLFNGNTPSASVVRAIDSNVVNLITRAANLGDSGTNNSGGGVITIIPVGVSSSHPAYLIMNLGPPAALAAGATWEITGQPAQDNLSAAQSVQELSSSASVGLQFLPVAGWNLPTNSTLTLTAGVNSCTASYTVAVQWATPAAILQGTALGSQQLNAKTITSGSYTYSPPPGTVLSVGSHTLSVTFTPTDPKYGGASTTNVTLVVLSGAPPVIQTARPSQGGFAFSWSATLNQAYQIQSTTNLNQANWVSVGGPITATNSTMNASLPATNSQQFYRLALLP